MSTQKQTPVKASTVATRRAATVLTMNKFETLLSASGSEVLDKRSRLVAKGATGALLDKITVLERQKDILDLEIENLTDVSIKNKDSLNPAGANFDAVKWIDRLAELRSTIKVIDLDLEVLYEIQDEFFTVNGSIVETE
jgi:hypothetical protein